MGDYFGKSFEGDSTSSAPFHFFEASGNGQSWTDGDPLGFYKEYGPTEGVGNNRTSEFGFAWYRMAELVAIVPEEKGKNWWPFLKAKHFLVDKYKGHPEASGSDD